MAETKIEWTEKTWNPVTGCTKVSPGCDHCYAEGIARRFAGSPAFPNGFDVAVRPDRLDAPLRWRKPSMVFVNSMSDLFHADVPDEFIARVWATMAATPQHTYQVLTKRHGRMRALLNDAELWASMWEGCVELIGEAAADELWGGRPDVPWPLPNVWVGVSAEDQQRADLRIPALLDTPAAVRFVSAEPLLGPIDLDRYLHHQHGERWPLERLHWVIVGGESGPGARPMAVEWASRLVVQGMDADVAVFVKQLGSAWARENGRRSTDPKGADWSITGYPDSLRVREWPGPR